MSNFTVSARKYRPGTFDTVIGQQHITQTLKNAIKKDHLGHALLFCGPRGVGKTSCARILAKTLNCENLTADGEPCGTCQACQSFQNQQSFNIYELDAASNNSVEDIRSLTEQVRFAPQTGKYKIYIIDEVHMLSTAAFNAFLKTLEEPPSYAIFILATTEKHKIIPTILSRCQVYDFHRIGVKEAMIQLKHICAAENIDAEEEALYVIAQKADGAMRDALSIFDRVVSFAGNKITYADVIENLNVLDYEYYFRATDNFLEQNLTESLLLFNEILDKGFDAHNFLNGLSEHLRNLLVCKDTKTIGLLELGEGTQNRYISQSAKMPMSFLLSALNILNQFDVSFKSSKNQRLHVELALMKLCFLPDAIHISSNGNGHAAEKKKPQPDDNLTEEKEPLKAAATETEQKPETVAKTASFSKSSTGSSSGLPSTGLNLNSIRAQILSQKNTKKAEETAETEVIADVFETVDPEKFTAAWKGFAENLKERNKSSIMHSAAKIQPQFSDDGSVILKVENDALRKLFNDERNNLREYLAENHNISNVKIEFAVEELSEEEMKKFIFTDTDKFKLLCEMNPAVAEMHRRLGLVIQ